MTEPGRYRFTHALMQETLLAELSTTRRVRLHGQVAEALERRFGDRADERAARLAPHFVESATLNREHAAKAARYSWLAGQQAQQVAAWVESIRHYQQCVTLIDDAGNPLGVDLAQVLTELGRCLLFIVEFRDAWRSLMRAIELYREREDGEGFARAVIAVQPIASPAARLHSLIDEVLALGGDTDSHTTARLLAHRARGSSDAAGREAAERAATLSAQHGFADVDAALLIQRADDAVDDGTVRAAADLLREAARTAFTAESTADAVYAQFMGVALTFMLGDFTALDRDLTALSEMGKRLRHADATYVASTLAGGLARLRGDLEEAVRLAPDLSATNQLDMLATVHAERGDVAAALALLATDVRPELRASAHAMRAWIRVAAGQLGAAAEELRPSTEAVGRVELAQNRLIWLCTVAEPAAAAGDDALVRDLYGQLIVRSEVRVAATSTSVDHARSALALRLGLVDEAESHFRTELAWAAAEGFPVEVGRAHQGLAEVAERRGDHAPALEHLDAAGELFNRYGAKLYLDQVLAKKEVLRA